MCPFGQLASVVGVASPSAFPAEFMALALCSPFTFCLFLCLFLFMYYLFAWRRAWQPTAVLLPGESHGQRSLAGSSPGGHRGTGLKRLSTAHSLAVPGLSCGTARSSIFLTACGIFCCGMWDLVPWSGIKPGPPALGVQSLSHWTHREVLHLALF